MAANRWLIHGHAIVSADERIADAEGRMPAALRNPADWRRFQAALDEAGVVVLGRRSHALTPNPRNRRRLVLSSAVTGLEQRPDAVWWNPAKVPLAEALAAFGRGGIAAVVGGRPVFDWFLAAGYDEFHLVRADNVRVPGGVPVFSGLTEGRSAGDLLAAVGLAPLPREALDPQNGVWLSLWRRPA